MTDPEKIGSAFRRVAAALRHRPALGRGTGFSRTRITDGLTCEIHEGAWTFTADMPEQAGGNAAGPTPGAYGRAALGSCLAIGYMMRAATMGIPVASLEVEVHADYDDGALFGTARGVPPGYLDVRYVVTIDSDAPEERIMELLDEADRHSPYLDVFSRAQNCQREVRIIARK
ncbi:MAG TPA: OsmC family protein [Puia sp.]|nr:OsmC family protein [Puia sp.]